MKKPIIKLLIRLSFTISGCSVDLKTKEIMTTNLKEQSVSIIDNYFNLTYVENHAVAFGMFRTLDRSIRMPIIFALPVMVSLLCLFFIWKIRKDKFRLLLPIFILLGGAFGNIIDRAMNGYVTDFLHLHYFHQYNFYVFNVADVLVNIGIILILLQYKAFNNVMDRLFEKRLRQKI